MNKTLALSLALLFAVAQNPKEKGWGCGKNSDCEQ
jgi:hypothetical protein